MTSTTNEAQRSDEEIIASISTSYDYGWHDSDAAGQSAKRGLDEQETSRPSSKNRNGCANAA